MVLRLETAHGGRVELDCDAMALVDDERAVVILSARGARVLKDASIANAFDGQSYVVVRRAGTFAMEGGAIAPPCDTGREPGTSVCSRCPALEAIETQAKTTRVLAVGPHDDRYLAIRATPIDEHRARVECVELDACLLAMALHARVDSVAGAAGLSPRERDVLNLLLLGRSLDELGVVLGISRHTAKFHQTNIIAKLGADSRFDLFRVLL